jgi:hypothetical protein
MILKASVALTFWPPANALSKMILGQLINGQLINGQLINEQLTSSITYLIGTLAHFCHSIYQLENFPNSKVRLELDDF